MSPEEHYFENLLFSYARGGKEQYIKCKTHDLNVPYFSEEIKHAIETCSTYIIDCCGWKQDTLQNFLTGGFECDHSCGCC